MVDKGEVKQQVRQFYDQVGWQKVDRGLYENALYEDLRPVSHEYVHNCRLRVLRHLQPGGRFLLDAGSGPVQYPEYVEYSQGYKQRVCVDISILALQEARQRLQEHGLYVVADIANLPFKTETFDGIVSLHTIHHLPQEEHIRAYRELQRVLRPGMTAVVVVGWGKPPLARLLNTPHRLVKMLQRLRGRLSGARKAPAKERSLSGQDGKVPKGTFVDKYNAGWLKRELGGKMPIEILVWRSLGGRTLRTYIHPALGGRFWLRVLYALEERFPRFFGENGAYPMIVIHKAQELGNYAA
jgi:SAM-dependent methyltransferase